MLKPMTACSLQHTFSFLLSDYFSEGNKTTKKCPFDPQKWKPADPFRWVKFSKNLQQIHL
jgi:hypothetical protein